jgi:hypothetical protein
MLIRYIGRKRTYYKENTEALVFVSKDIRLEGHAEITKYMVKSQDLETGRSQRIKIDNSSLERLQQF